MNIKEFLSELSPFNQLPPQIIAAMAEKMQPWRYRMGQVILRKEKMPPHIAILYEGQVRRLGYDPRNTMPVTLELLEPGAVMGWINLARRIPTETAIASSEEVICLTLNNKDFLELLDKYPQLQQYFRDQCALIEIFDLLGYQLEKNAYSTGNLKDLALQALAKAEVCYLPKGKVHSQQLDALRNSRQSWLLSGGELEDLPIGSHIDFEEVDSLEIKNEHPVRLVGIPLQELLSGNRVNSEDLQGATPSNDSEQSAEAFQQGGEGGLVLLTEPTPNQTQSTTETAKNDIPLAKGDLEEDPEFAQQRTQTQKDQKYPFYSGKDPVDAGVAIFRMLGKYFGMPSKTEILRRVIDDQMKRYGTLSLNGCGAIAELIGLNAQLIKIPAQAVSRLNAPVLLRWQDGLAILYEISEKTIVIAVPEIGILRRKTEDFLETWGQEGEVILLKTTKETPQERFGLDWFLPSVWKYRRVLLEVFIASFFVQLFALANPLMIQVILDQVIGSNSVSTLNVLGIFLLFVAVVEALLSALRTYLFVDTSNRIDMTLGSEIIDHLLRLPLRYFEKRPVGEISTRINELENIRQFLTGTALTVVLDALFSVLYIIVMVIYSPMMTAVALSNVPIFIFLTYLFAPTIRKQLRTKAERNAETQSYLVEVLSGIQTVKAQNIELKSRWEWQNRYARYVDAGFQTVITSTTAGALSSFFSKVSSLSIIWFGSYLVLKGDLSIGQMIAFRIISGYVTSPLLRLAQLWQNFQEVGLSLERLADIVDTPEEGEEDRENIAMPLIVGKVKYEDVCFRFKQANPLQLNNVTLEFPAGTFAAIVGQSGAGKSTLTKLLSRLYEAESGRILVDDYDINKVELYSLRSQIGVVPQETLLFDGTVRDNIALTNPDANTEEVIHAAKVASAHEFIMNLPNGYNTRVGERGSALSGGQRQRIAIARSVLQNPRMLILDEATSALDYATEQSVCQNLIHAFSDRTVFFITHRLGTIQNADVIIMMESGIVVEQGTHEELMALKGRYYYLSRQQEKK